MSQSPGGGEQQHTITIDAQGAGNKGSYDFTVNGTVSKAGAGGTGANPSDRIVDMGDGTFRVIGHVWSGTDKFTYTGEITQFSTQDVSGTMTILVDGQPKQPSQIGTGGGGEEGGGGSPLSNLSQRQKLLIAAGIGLFLMSQEKN